MNMAETIPFQGLRGELKYDEPMARHVSWRAGGPARRFFAPVDLVDLSNFIGQLPTEEPLLFVGLGSNLLVRDGGWPGTVILTHGAAKRPHIESGMVYAEAGVACPKLSRFAAMNKMGGAEFLTGIPGTVGGALAMNAGCYGGETWDIVQHVVTIHRTGQLRWRDKKDFDISYRHCELKADVSTGEDEWFAAAYFKLPDGDTEESRAIMQSLLEKRRKSQPLQLPNAGSVFRNPEDGKPAARLIQFSGLKKLEHNGARVSEVHANFIVNPKGAAKASDIEWLIDRIRTVVKEETGVELQTEVRIVGSAE